MSLQFYFGPSGCGKSRQLYEDILRRAGENPKQNFLIIVPDQFTMQTQKDLVMLSENGGILNIDVLSFGRLSHRILEEVGWENVPVLDDTGKSLVLQRVASGLGKDLPTLGGLLNRQGYIHEVKSVISEFMQYGIGTQDVSRLIECVGKRGALVQKLKDLEKLYQGFVDYIQGNFITTEEKLDVLTRSLEKSKLLPGSVVIFDGFTGFTPIQNRVIQELMCRCSEVIVTVTLGAGENPYEQDGEQKLFHLSKKTVADLDRLAKESNVERSRDVFIDMSGKHRFVQAPALAHLERNLFRYPYEIYRQNQDEIHIFEAVSPAEEVQQAGLEICRLIRTQNLAYRDIAVILGDLESYAPYVETEFAGMGIPCYLDATRGLVLNPMIEYIKSALELFEKDFSYPSVFHYLRSGLADLEPEEVDELENYCIQTGLRGYRNWSRLFVHRTEQMGQDEECLKRLNGYREEFLSQVEMLHLTGGKAGAKDYVDRLYDFLTANRVQQKLANYQTQFEEKGDLVRAREYAQIYRLVMELLEQIYEMLGEEKISLAEFKEILEAGFGEIQVGTIPQNVDRIIVGDMERTRLKQVKVLFFLGVNDGNIPKNTSKGGIISDMDREFLRESDLELAPSPRQQMYIQRLYLYLNLTKPSERLYLSFSKVNSAGKSIRPAYLVEVVQNLFCELLVDCPENRPVTEQIASVVQGRFFLAQSLREYAEGSLREEEEKNFFTLYQVYGAEEMKADRERLTGAAFTRYQDSPISALVARLLYGRNLYHSVTRLETYAACAYRHFLQYGLSLKERDEFGFENTDLGNVYHAVLQSFGEKLAEGGYTWFNFSREFGESAVRESLEAYAAVYGDTVLYSSARNEYAIRRMERVLIRTVFTLQTHLQKGKFIPSEYEFSFRTAENLNSVNVTLSEEEKLHLQGRIDRIDTAEDEEHVYVKVVDYKSGSRQFDLVALYYGLQLQLVVYMNAALEAESKKHPDKEIVPAALLYYHVDDPVVDEAAELSEEELNEKIVSRLKMNGVVNAQPEIVERLDAFMGDKSTVIPVAKKKNGEFTATSSVMSTEEMQLVSEYVNKKIREIGQEMLQGCIRVNPYEKGISQACTYCSYKNVCGFDGSIPGYEKRKLKEYSQNEIFEKMKE